MDFNYQTIKKSNLQRKITELEQNIDQLQMEIESKKGFRKNLNDQDVNELFPKLPPKNTLSGHRQNHNYSAGVNHLVFHPEYAQIASASDDSTIKLWDLETGKYEQSLKGHTQQVNYLSFHPQGRYIVSASSDLSIKIWDETLQFKCIKTLYGHDHTVSCVEFINDQEIISCSRDKSIKLWNIQSGFCLQTFQGHSDWVRRLSIHQNGSNFASCGNDQSILIWDKKQNGHLQTLIGHEHVIECILYVNNEKSKQHIIEFKKLNQLPQKLDLLLSGSRDKVIRLWNVFSGVCLFIFEGHDNWVKGLAFHHSFKFFYSCSDDKTIRIWDFSTGKCIKKIEAHLHFVTCISSSQKYLSLVSGSVDNSIKIWFIQ